MRILIYGSLVASLVLVSTSALAIDIAVPFGSGQLAAYSCPKPLAAGLGTTAVAPGEPRKLGSIDLGKATNLKSLGTDTKLQKASLASLNLGYPLYLVATSTDGTVLHTGWLASEVDLLRLEPSKFVSGPLPTCEEQAM